MKVVGGSRFRADQSGCGTVGGCGCAIAGLVPGRPVSGTVSLSAQGPFSYWPTVGVASISAAAPCRIGLGLPLDRLNCPGPADALLSDAAQPIAIASKDIKTRLFMPKIFMFCRLFSRLANLARRFACWSEQILSFFTGLSCRIRLGQTSCFQALSVAGCKQIIVEHLCRIDRLPYDTVDQPIQGVGRCIEQTIPRHHLKRMYAFAADVLCLASGKLAPELMMMGSGTGGGRDQVTQPGQMQRCGWYSRPSVPTMAPSSANAVTVRNPRMLSPSWSSSAMPKAIA